MTDAYAVHRRLIPRLIDLTANGAEPPEADAIRDQLEPLWHWLTEGEKQAVRRWIETCPCHGPTRSGEP